jgi:hypothetical protein
MCESSPRIVAAHTRLPIIQVEKLFYRSNEGQWVWEVYLSIITRTTPSGSA